MKIAIAIPRCNNPHVIGERLPFHGPGFLYSVLKESGYNDIDFYDFFSGDKRIPISKNYDIACIYTNFAMLREGFSLINKIKAKEIFVGGPGTNLIGDSYLRHKKISKVIEGEAEHIIVDLIEGRIKKNHIKTKRLSNEDLDKLPRSPFELFYNKPLLDLYHIRFPVTYKEDPIRPVYSMNTSRGCPHDCEFCTVRDIWGRRVTTMSPERIFDDMKYLYSLGVKGILFREDNFTFSRRRVEELCSLILKNNFKMKWFVETRVDSVDRELIDLMDRAGCVGAFIGAEYLTNRMLQIYNKGITVEQIKNFLSLAKEYDWRVLMTFIFSHPKETKNDLREHQKVFSKLELPNMITIKTHNYSPSRKPHILDKIVRGFLKDDKRRNK